MAVGDEELPADVAAAVAEVVAVVPPVPGQAVVPEAMWCALRRAYRAPVRHYHTLAHAAEVAHWTVRVQRAVGWRQPAEAYWAALFHDAVYLCGRADNELLSAELAVSSLERWLPGAAVDSSSVRRLIELTALHGQLRPSDLGYDEALFVDCDMAILGAGSDDFCHYEQGVQREYLGVMPRERYHLGRRHFLERLLASPAIFMSEYFQATLEHPARQNLQAALRDL